MIQRWTSRQGYFTLEAVLVMSTIFLALSLLIVSFLLMYHQVLLTQAASIGAQEASKLWSSYYGDQYGRLREDALFSQVCNAQNPEKPSSLVDRKLKHIEEDLQNRLKPMLGKPEHTKIDIMYSNHLVTRKVDIRLTQEIKIPFGQLKAFFSGKETVTLRAQAVSEILEPAEFIRNVDLVLECGHVFVKKINGIEDIKALIQKEDNPANED